MAGIQALFSCQREYSQSFLGSKLLLFSCCVWLFVTPWTTARQASLSFTISQSLLKLMSFESVMPSNLFILCQPILLPTIFPSIRVFSSESALYIKWPKYYSFSFSTSPSNEYSGLISFRIDKFDLDIQGTLKSLLQHYSSKTSILWCSAFFMVQFWKTIALTLGTFVSKVISLLFNTLSRFIISFHPRSKVSSNFMAVVTIHSDFGALKEEIYHCFHLFPSYLP